MTRDKAHVSLEIPLSDLNAHISILDLGMYPKRLENWFVDIVGNSVKRELRLVLDHHEPFVTNNGNYIIDLHLKIINGGLKKIMKRVLEDGPWIVLVHYLSISKWRPNFRPSNKEVDSTAVWSSSIECRNVPGKNSGRWIRIKVPCTRVLGGPGGRRIGQSPEIKRIDQIHPKPPSIPKSTGKKKAAGIAVSPKAKKSQTVKEFYQVNPRKGGTSLEEVVMEEAQDGEEGANFDRLFRNVQSLLKDYKPLLLVLLELEHLVPRRQGWLRQVILMGLLAQKLGVF
ncbi:hypothetical protein M9H77_10955 [Catharanthus roseus]|uniref:Uncharacterized protein n=1 Tax=Catharanthus roseus TaxID=4058 RepID=A0ACC0BD56_CATRO|nr:hypothetical protein M9H77_10955 [Catharanthus roseus]